MRPKLQVFLRGKNQARVVTGSSRDSAEANALEKWLTGRRDVVRFERREATSEFDIHYDDGDDLPGHFIRALRDKLYTLKRRESFAVHPVHSLPGRVRIRVKGIHAQQFEALTVLGRGLPGITSIKHLPGSYSTVILYEEETVTEQSILDFYRKLEPADLSVKGHRPAPLRWGAAVSDTAALLLALSGIVPFPIMASWIAVNALRPLRRSLEALSEGRISIDLLDVAATFAALATRRPVTAAFVLWMVGIGDFLLDISANAARSALSPLIKLAEHEAFRVLADESVERVSVNQLVRGDRILVSSGQAIVADGKVVSGSAEVDQKSLTGESELVAKKEGKPVFASTSVTKGQIIVEVASSGKNTEAAKIARVLETIGTKPTTLQRNALDFASKLVLPTFGVAGLATFLSGDVSRGICILITDFGTGIRIAVPTSAMTAVALAAREGVLVKGAQYLERLSMTDVIIFDKTGTLTHGMPEVVEVVTKNGFPESKLIELCASAESQYDHPVAKALTAFANLKDIPLVEPEPGSQDYVVGLGLSARVNGKRVYVGRASWLESKKLKIAPIKKDLARLKKNQVSTLCVAVDDEVVGLIGYSDGTRPEAARLVEQLRAHGKRKVVLLSGDNAETVKKVAWEVGIDDAVGGLLPQQKADYVKRMQAAGHVVAMVGDGVNDVPALAAADIGISISGSTTLALETADVILLEGGLARLEKAFRISDQAMHKVRQNLGIIVVPNAIAIALGALGLITPPIAALINNGATLLAVLVGTAPLLIGPSVARGPDN